MTSWTDPATGLSAGPVVEPDYPQRCRHCAQPIRPHQSWWLDEHGFFRCMKNVDHAPMPEL